MGLSTPDSYQHAGVSSKTMLQTQAKTPQNEMNISKDHMMIYEHNE